MRCLLASLLLTLSMAAAAAEEVGVSPSAYTDDPVLAQYLEEAAQSHPTLHGLHAEWLAQLERIPQATSLEDPMFTFGQFVRSDTARFRVAIGQQFPWFGTLKLRGERAAIEAEALFTDMVAQRNRLIADVKQAYYEYAYLSAQQAVLGSQLQILGQVEETITTQFGLGYAREDALLRAQIEKASLQDRLKRLEQYRPALSARLSERIGRPVHELLPFPEALPDLRQLPQEAVVLDIIEKQSPELAGAEYRVEAEQKAVELAKKEKYPNISVEIEYMAVKQPETPTSWPSPDSLNATVELSEMITGRAPVDVDMAVMDLYELNMMGGSMGADMKDEIELSVTMNVPLWRKRIRAGIREAALQQEAAEAAQAGLSLRLKRSAAEMLFEFNDAVRRMDLYKQDLLPQAERVYESILVGYSVGIDADVLDLLASVDQLLAFQLEQRAAHRDALLATAELEFLMGRPLDAALPEQQDAPGSL
jgi:outer membrane protein TolC